MSRLLYKTRYVIALPIIGLALAAAFFFIIGAVGLLQLMAGSLLGALGLADATAAKDTSTLVIKVIEYVHEFLIGTVLYITAVGFYQLFIGKIELAGWMKVRNADELETNLIGVTVVVLAVNFMGTILGGQIDQMLQYGAAIALPIAALGLFIGLRAWAEKQHAGHSADAEEHTWPAAE